MSLLLLIVLLADYASGLPTILRPSNDTKVEPSWVQDPEGRGTAGLMLSCVLTLGLCVWTAVHLNVEAGVSPTKILRRKFLWVLIGLFAPEIVLLSSYEQWQKARSLHKRVRHRGCDASVCSANSEFKLKEALQRTQTFIADSVDGVQSLWRQYTGIQELKPVHPFSMTCSFFIVMGGTTIAANESIVDDKTGNNTTVTEYTLTPEGFEYLLDVEILKDDCLETRTIQDKGKADFLAKFLVCVQAAWMILQCILRKLNDLPVSLLELNTLLHVAIALIMYYFWWEKPLNVSQPIKVSKDTDLAAILFALDMRRSQDIIVSMSDEEIPVFDIQSLKRQHETLYNKLPQHLQPDIAIGGRILGTPPEDWLRKDTKNRKWALWDLARAKRRVKKCTDSEDTGVVTLLRNQSIEETETNLDIGELSDKDLETMGDEDLEAPGRTSPKIQTKKSRALISSPTHPVTLTKSDVQVLFRAAKALMRPEYARIKEDYKNPVHLAVKKNEPFRVRRMKNLHFDIDIVLSDIYDWDDPHTILSLLNIIYGASLASVWNSHFPTPLEKWMWRFSCLLLLLPTLVTTAKWITQQCPTKWRMDYYIGRALQVLLHPVVAVYFCARVFVVVESFISIRSLPVGSYETVQMSEYWPHF